MLVANSLGFCLLIIISVLQRTLAIMVPTGKVGPITPRKMPEVVVVEQPYREPAAVWERVDEGPNPYQPPVYKYTLLDFARKYGRKTLIPPPENEYYKSLLMCSGFVCYGDPRIDDIDENENLIEYSYRYAVDDSKSRGPVMDRWEQRIGEYVKGAYSVVDPDGRVRTVDYEVDGKKGYHAVIRMNEPGPELLSIQQLTKSFELFPEASLPTPPDTPSRNLSPPDSSDGKAWNYHSNTPYVNQIGLKQDHKEAATTRITKTASAIRNLENLPPSPANYNVPQTTNLIYYSAPAASIFHQTFKSLESDNSLPRAIKRESFFPILIAEDDDFGLQRRRRNSKLVRRYKSFADVLS